MKTFKSLIESLAEAWPGTPEYKKKFGSPSADGPDGSRHKIDRTPGITRATRKYDAESGESEEPTKSREDAAAAPAKRGRGRPPGKYGSYKKKVKESLEILESLETEEEISEFVDSLDEESFAELEEYFALDEVSWQTAMAASNKSAAKVNASKSPEEREKNVAQMKRLHKSTMDRINATPNTRKGPSGYQRSTAGRLGEETEELQAYLSEEQVDEAQSHAAKTTMKHIKNPTKGEVEASKRMKSGIAGYRDRIAMLHSAKNRGALKEEEVDEALKHPNHKVLDKNRNNRLDKEDFAILRGEKKAPVKETKETSVESVAAFLSQQAKGEA
jgi:hypothetical protein